MEEVNIKNINLKSKYLNTARLPTLSVTAMHNVNLRKIELAFSDNNMLLNK